MPPKSHNEPLPVASMLRPVDSGSFTKLAVVLKPPIVLDKPDRATDAANPFDPEGSDDCSYPRRHCLRPVFAGLARWQRTSFSSKFTAATASIMILALAGLTSLLADEFAEAAVNRFAAGVRFTPIASSHLQSKKWLTNRPSLRPKEEN